MYCNLAKTRRRGRKVIGQRATVNVPGQRGANITMCAALSSDGLLLHKPLIGPYNTERLISFLDDLHNHLVPVGARGPRARNTFVVFSAWRWKVYDHSPHDLLSLLDAMTAGCGDVSPEACQGWIRHSKRFFPRCIAREDIRCDVDENMWPNAEDRE